MSDVEIRGAVCRALVAEPVFAECEISEVAKGQTELVRGSPRPPSGSIQCSVEDGVVTLTGDLPSLEHKRLAAVLEPCTA